MPAPGVSDASDDSLEEHQEWLLALAALAAVLLVVLYVVAVRTAWGQRLDNAALDGRTTRLDVLHATSRLLDTITIASVMLLGGAAVAIAVARRRLHLAVTAGLMVLGANVTTQLLKHVVLSRPELADNDPLARPSFPSGHTTVAMTLAMAFVLVVPDRLRTAAAGLGLAYACLIGTGTVTAGWHRPSDVIAAFLVVALWVGVATAVLMRWSGAVDADDDHESDIHSSVAKVGAALLALGFIGFVIVYLALRLDRLHAVRLDGAYAASLIVIVGFGSLVMSAVFAAVRGVELDVPRVPISRAASHRGTAPPTR